MGEFDTRRMNCSIFVANSSNAFLFTVDYSLNKDFFFYSPDGKDGEATQGSGQMMMIERMSYTNEGFSGGEKKRNEIFQMAMLEPKLAILDETDSGLDIDALRIVAHGVNQLRTPENAAIVITHYQRLLDYIKPDVVHVLYKGRIVKTAGPELALELEEKGYDWIKKEMGDE